MAECEQVISPGQLVAEMGIDADVPAGSNQILALAEGDVHLGLRVDDEARQAEIDQMNNVWVVAKPHHDIVRFQISMNHVQTMHVLKALKKLIENHEGGFVAELSATELEEVF